MIVPDDVKKYTKKYILKVMLQCVISLIISAFICYLFNYLEINKIFKYIVFSLIFVMPFAFIIVNIGMEYCQVVSKDFIQCGICGARSRDDVDGIWDYCECCEYHFVK